MDLSHLFEAISLKKLVDFDDQSSSNSGPVLRIIQAHPPNQFFQLLFWMNSYLGSEGPPQIVASWSHSRCQWNANYPVAWYCGTEGPQRLRFLKNQKVVFALLWLCRIVRTLNRKNQKVVFAL